MEISGFDHVFFSNISFQTIIEAFEKELKIYWPDFIVDDELLSDDEEEKERHERFYSKNVRMLEVHEEHVFNSKLKGEGCIYLIAVKQTQYDLLMKVKKELEPKREIAGPAPYNSRLILLEGWQYTLVTPGTINEEGFSKTIFEKLIYCFKALQNET